MKLALFIISLLTSLNSIAAVSTNGVFLNGTSWTGGTNDYVLGIYHGSAEPTCPSCSSQMIFSYSPVSGVSGSLGTNPASITILGMTADAGVDIYFANSGQEFSAANISAGSFSQLAAVSGNTYNIPSRKLGSRYFTSGTFYLGLNSGANIFPPVNNKLDRSIFGWAQFSFNSTGIKLINSAVTYDQAGIFIGTSNTVPVPEPDAYAMMLMGLGLMGFVARRRNNQQV